MDQTRRTLLKSTGLGLAAGLAGCSGNPGSGSSSPTGGTSSTNSTGTGTATEQTDAKASASANVAVAAEMNVLRSRLADAVALGTAGEFSAGANVAADVLKRFEADEHEWGTHERMEKASHDAYEQFEGAVERVETGLKAEKMLQARSAAQEANGAVRTAMGAMVDASVVDSFDVQWFGGRAANSGSLAAAGNVEAAATVADETLASFEDAPAHGALEDASHDAYERFESSLKAVRNAGKDGDSRTVASESRTALTAAIDGSYALAGEKEAGAGELAVMQAGAWDAHALTRLESSVNAGAVVEATFKRFENARVHETLEQASHEAYERFESSLKAYQNALTSGDSVSSKLDAFVSAAVTAEFTVVGAADKAPTE